MTLLKGVKIGVTIMGIIVVGAMFRSCTIAIEGSRDRMMIKMEEQRKPQVIMTDSDGNKVWRGYDSERSEFIYYIPKGNTNWEKSNGRSTETMGVR